MGLNCDFCSLCLHLAPCAPSNHGSILWDHPSVLNVAFHPQKKCSIFYGYPMQPLFLFDSEMHWPGQIHHGPKTVLWRDIALVTQALKAECWKWLRVEEPSLINDTRACTPHLLCSIIQLFQSIGLLDCPHIGVMISQGEDKNVMQNPVVTSLEPNNKPK